MATLHETHFGVVTDNVDPDKRGRIKCRSQSLVGYNISLPDWLEPLAGVMVSPRGGALWVPEIGATVELVIDAHDTELDDMPGEAFLRNPNIKWRPGTYTDKNGPMPLPKDFVGNYPNVRGFVTPAGHKWLVDDKGKFMGFITAAGHSVVLDDGQGTLTITSKAGGVIQLTSNGNITINNPTLLGSATDLMILGQQFMALYNVHSHATALGPSGPPLVLMTTAQLSQNGHKVG